MARLWSNIKHFANVRSPSRWAVIAIAISAVGLTGMAYAATNIFASQESESGTKTGNVVTVSDTSASGGLAVKFGAAGCSGTINDPGGPDPWGGCWPGPNSTGVPAGTVLTNVPGQATSGTGWNWDTGDQVVFVTQCGVVLDGLDIHGDVYVRQGNGTASASSPCVTIKNSRVYGHVNTSDACLISRCGPLLMTDVEIDTSAINVTRANVLYDNIYEWRVNNHGGNGPMHCAGNCELHDGWYHGLTVQNNYHMNAVGSTGTGAGNRFTVRHSYLSCGWDQAAIFPNTIPDEAGCTADLAMLPDFASVTLTAEYNYFAPALTTGPYAPYQPGYCIDPGQGTLKPYPTLDVYIAHNVFARGPTGKCGLFGPVYGWGNGDVHTYGTDSGNVWGPGNQWDDGTSLNPGEDF